MGKKSRAKKERKAFEAIVAAMPDLDARVATFYDDYGWPAGEESERAARALLEDWLNRLDADGWDQPNSVMLVYKPEVAAADFAAEGIDVGELGELVLEEYAEDPSRTVAGGFMSTATKQFDMHPTDAFWGQTAEPEVSAMAVAVEAWGGQSRGGKRVSEDPQRVEMRLIQFLTRSGDFFQISKLRGSNTVMWDKGAEGPIGAVMHQFLGVPIPASWKRMSLQQFCGLIAADRSTQALLAVGEAQGSDALDPTGARGVLLTDVMIKLWNITDRGKNLTVRDRAVLTPVLTDRSELPKWLWDEDTVAGLIEATRRAFERLDWEDYISSPTLVEDTEIDIFPQAISATVGWADDDFIQILFGSKITSRPTQPLDRLPKKIRKACVELLDELGLT